MNVMECQERGMRKYDTPQYRHKLIEHYPQAEKKREKIIVPPVPPLHEELGDAGKE